MGLFKKNTGSAARQGVLKKGTKPRDLLIRRNQVGRLIKLEDDAHTAIHRIDEGATGEKRYKAADRAYQEALRKSTPAERKAAENAVKHAPYLKKN